MYNSNQQKPYSQSQHTPIELDDKAGNEASGQTQRLVEELSDRISKLMCPLYDQFRHQTENGKVLGCYPILKFGNFQEPSVRPKAVSSFSNYYNIDPDSNSNSNPYSNPVPKVANFRELSNRVQQKQRLDYQSTISESKIHQLLDQNEARQYDDDSGEKGYGVERNQQMKKLEKARKYYEKLARDVKSGKKFKRRFKDKNRPKKAKSAYNLFVEDVVPQIKAENPSFSAPDLVRVAAKMYNQLTEEQKLPYQRRYLIDKERFQREREAYFRKNPEMDYRLDAKTKTAYMNGRYGGLG